MLRQKQSFRRLLVAMVPGLLLAFGVPSVGWSDVCEDPNEVVNVTPQIEGNVLRVTVDWCHVGEKLVEKRITSPRIAQGTTVDFHIKNFNFLHYTLKDEVKEVEVPTYRLLERLFSQSFTTLGVFGIAAPNLTAAGISDPNEFFETYKSWRLGLSDAEKRLDEVLLRYQGKVGLESSDVKTIECQFVFVQGDSVYKEKCPAFPQGSDAQFDSGKQIGADRVNFPLLMRQLDSLSEDARNQANNAADLDRYLDTMELQRKVFERIAVAMALGRKTSKGTHLAIASEKSGYVKTVILTPMDRSGQAAGAAVSTEYFVHSKLPVYFHVGYTFSDVDDVDFEQVRTVAGSDLFVQVQDEEFTSGLTAFMTLNLADKIPVPVGLTLGTDFTDPGEKLYFGATVRLGQRFNLTGGWASQLIEQGENPVLEEIGEQLGARELFTTIDRIRSTELFAGISFTVY